MALEPDTDPALFDELGLARRIDHTTGDIRDAAVVQSTMRRVRPEVLFHLAAQPLVRRSYAEPIYTFDTNVMGTANVLELPELRTPLVRSWSSRPTRSYRNNESGTPFAEDDRSGA